MIGSKTVAVSASSCQGATGTTTGTDGSREREGSDEGYGVRREGFLAALDDDVEEAVVEVAY